MPKTEVFHQVDCQWAESRKFAVRNEAETKRIVDFALKLAGGKADGARWLLRAAMYQFCGQTWDENLFYTEEGDDLMGEKDICDEMGELSRLGAESISKDLVDMTCQSLVFEIADSPFYIGMAIDLLGRSAAVGQINGKLKEMGLPTFPEEVLAECEWYYNRVAERRLSEWEDDFVSSHVFETLEVLKHWESELRIEMTEDERRWTMTGYLNNCFSVDMMLNEVLARGLVGENRKLVFRDKDSGEVKALTFKEAVEILQRVNR